MKRPFQILLLVFAIAFPPVSAWGESEDALVAVEETLLELANRARRSPLEMAASLGLDPARVLADFPDLADILTDGLPPLAADERLRASARGHVRDMVERGYFDEVSPEGRTPLDRAVAAGYPAGTADESLGMLAFLNFMEPAVAAERIFANVFLDELRPGENSPLRILNPDFREIGVGFGSRQGVLAGRTFNMYIAALDFGVTLVEDLSADDVASAFLRLVNQARTVPLAVGAAMGYDPEAMAADHPVLAETLPPVRLNPALVETARSHLHEMIAGGFFDPFSADGRSPQDRIRAAGYPDGAWTAGRLAIVRDDDFDLLSDVVQALFDDLFHSERLALHVGEAVLLHPEIREFGFAMGRILLDSDGRTKPFHVAVFDFGAYANPLSSPRILLTFYRDEDGDGLYSIGEGMAGFEFEMVGYDTSVFPAPKLAYGMLVADGAGGLTVEGQAGIFLVRSDFGNGTLRWNFRLGIRDLFVPVAVGDMNG